MAPPEDGKPAYRRILLKLSGEALMGEADYGIDPAVHQAAGPRTAAMREYGTEVGVVIGGGNIFRGAGLARAGMDRVTADQMGMLATVINSLALQDALEGAGVFVRVMSAIAIKKSARTTSAGARSATWRRGASRSSRRAPATRSSRPTPRPPARDRDRR